MCCLFDGGGATVDLLMHHNITVLRVMSYSSANPPKIRSAPYDIPLTAFTPSGKNSISSGFGGMRVEYRVTSCHMTCDAGYFSSVHHLAVFLFPRGEEGGMGNRTFPIA